MNHLLLTAMAAATLLGCATPAEMTASQTTNHAPLPVFAAGSLREAMTDIARDYENRTDQKITLTFGASGLLRERIEKGDAALVFASADIQHPQRLANAGAWGAPAVPTLPRRRPVAVLTPG
jgi:molybdate transport system substrate-binding protein